MAPLEEMHTAMVNRSIRAIKAELEFLTDASIITPQTLSSILSQIPPQTALYAPISVGALPTAAAPLTGTSQPPIAGTQTASYNDGQVHPQQQTAPYRQEHKQHYDPVPSPANAPPPAYNTSGPGPGPDGGAARPTPAPRQPALCAATALYDYKGEDAGDLTLRVDDAVEVSEYMNAEWWRGRSARTGEVGIFPRSYVRVTEPGMPGAPPGLASSSQQQQQQQYGQGVGAGAGAGAGAGGGYGNAPLETSGVGDGEGKVPNKGQEMGKRFGRKLGNAAVFGAGATIGSNIVNSIF